MRLALRHRRGVMLALACMGLAACNGPDKPPPKKRTDAVAASPSSVAAKASASASAKPTASVVANEPPRDPCAGQQPREDAPGELALARAVGGAKKPGKLAYGKGRWVWVNVWAAWCEPCKKEMPVLRAWHDKLADAGVKLDLVFVSIDDDARELDRFLEAQPETGLRATYWLHGEEAQDKWFETVGFDDTPTLPIQTFVNPTGKTACVVSGAVEPGDYAALAKMFGASS
jgi:thiol-disulfide isomerase/thioredoxin